jgi:uncharacterized membrane protein YbhN (UPF0104 family)
MERSGGHKLRRASIVLVKAAVAVGLLAWLYARGWIDLRPLAAPGTAWLHLAAIAVTFGGFLVQVVRWRLLLRTFSVDLPLRHALVISMIALFGSLALPGFVGIEVIRAVYVARHAPGRKLAASLSVVLDRVIGLYSFLLLSVSSLVWLVVSGSPSQDFARKTLALVAIPFAALTTALVAPWVGPVRRAALRLAPGRVREPLAECMAAYVAAPLAFASALALSVVATLAVVASFLIASVVAGERASWMVVASVTPIVVAVGVLPLTPQGLGVVETSAAFLFSRFGVESGATIALVTRLWGLATCLPGAILYVVHRAEVARPPADA